MQNNDFFMPATENQLNLLRRYKQEGKYTGIIDGLTKGEAMNIISNLTKNTTQQNTYNNNNYQSATNPQQSATNQQLAKVDTSVVAALGVADDLMANLTELANDGTLYIPENYSVGNALKSAMSKILTSDQSAALMACTPESKKQALTEYVVQGLDASKNQAYFIPFGNKMTMMRSYFGDVAVVKRTGLVHDVYAIVIYEGDEIEIGFDDYGRETLITHKTSFQNKDNRIIGAYAVAVGINDYKAYCFMTRKELETSWSMSKVPTEKNKFQNNFMQEAAKRTVIRRLVKMLFNTSLNTTDEQNALIGSYNRTTEDEYDDTKVINAEVKNQTNEEVKEEQKKKTASKKATPDSEDWLEDND